MKSAFEILDSMIRGRVADWASVVGLFVALIGFIITIVNVHKSKSAVERTNEAVTKLREDSRRVSLASDCSMAISIMDQIKALHRQGEWRLLPDKYSALRKVLIAVKAFDSDLNDSHRSTVQGAILIFRGMERKIETVINDEGHKMDVVRVNTVISDQVDLLQELLIEIKDRIGR